jgi:hypothetical protein
MEEPPQVKPRRATTLTRLWRSTDAADCIAQCLPTKSLAVLPTLARLFRKDQLRQLDVLMRRQRAAVSTRVLLSTLQMAGRDAGHLREDWADQARVSERWNGFRAIPRDGLELDEAVDFTVMNSQGMLVLDRTTPRNSSAVGYRNNMAGVGDRCYVQRFRVALTYTGNNEGSGAYGSNFRLKSEIKNRTTLDLVSIFIASNGNGDFRLRWRGGEDLFVAESLKTVHNPHTFLIDATLDWDTGTATVTVDGVEHAQPLPFRPWSFKGISFSAEHSGQHTLGPVDVWYLNTPPPQPPSCVRFLNDS